MEELKHNVMGRLNEKAAELDGNRSDWPERDEGPLLELDDVSTVGGAALGPNDQRRLLALLRLDLPLLYRLNSLLSLLRGSAAGDQVSLKQAGNAANQNVLPEARLAKERGQAPHESHNMDVEVAGVVADNSACLSEARLPVLPQPLLVLNF